MSAGRGGVKGPAAGVSEERFEMTVFSLGTTGSVVLARASRLALEPDEGLYLADDELAILSGANCAS